MGQFISATEESSHPFASFQFDGVLGLSLPIMAQGPGFSMMERMKDNKSLKNPLFGVFLSDTKEEESEITFGQIKQDHIDSEIFWVPVSRSSGYWEVKIDDITLGDQEQNLCQDCRVAVDTGTSQLAGPTDITDKLTSLLDVKDDCSNFDSLPKLGFVIGGHILNLEPRDYVDKAFSSCSLSLMALDVPPPKGPLFIFGIPFLQKFYTVYDQAEKKVGFALAKHTSGKKEGILVDITQRHTKAVRKQTSYKSFRGSSE